MAWMTSERLALILRRQLPGRYGKDYDPSIHATRREAPRISRPSILQWPAFGRSVHFMSQPETIICCLALYHPSLFELHEQKMLPITPRLHPLALHEKGVGLNLPEIKGSIEVAERMGELKRHAVVRGRVGGAVRWLPFPYLGDLLPFLEDETGPYIVNWSVKADHRGFTDRRPDDPVPRNPAADIAATEFRHALEDGIYSSGVIRTQRCALSDVPKQLQINLRNLVAWRTRAVPYGERRIEDIVGKLRGEMANGVPASLVIQQSSRGSAIDVEHHLTVYYQAIFDRKLRVDLLSPLLVDRPPIPEKTDVLNLFEAWFKR